MQDESREKLLLTHLKQWRQFINTLEREYKGQFDDYLRELSVRDDIAALQTAQLAQSTTLTLADLDKRFFSATIERFGSTPDPERPWHTRFPRLAGKELANQLAEETLALIRNSPVPTGHSKIDETGWPPHVWVFNGSRNGFPSATFSTKERADAWIASNRVSGMLTGYPLDIGVHEWTVAKGYFKADEPRRQTPSFIAGFSHATLPHYHYEEGVEESGSSGSGL